MTCNDTMSIFPKIKDMNPSDAQSAREALLRYCELDTWGDGKGVGKVEKSCIQRLNVFEISLFLQSYKAEAEKLYEQAKTIEVVPDTDFRVSKNAER